MSDSSGSLVGAVTGLLGIAIIASIAGKIFGGDLAVSKGKRSSKENKIDW